MNRRYLLLASVPAALALTPLGTAVLRTPTVAAASPTVDAKIEIVFPHFPSGVPASVGNATRVNVEVYLFRRGTLNPVGCDFANTVRLRWALNEGATSELPPHPSFGQLLPTGIAVPGYELPAEAVGQKQLRTANGASFPYWLFNDVPVFNGLAVAKPETRSTYFVVTVDGADYRTNVWAHSADPRTFLPTQLTPQALVSSTPSEVDAIIQVVYPHDATGKLAPVTRAPLANVAVDLFQNPIPFEFPSAAKPTVVGTDLRKSVWLLRALNDGYLERVKPADQTVTYHGNVVWPRYIFNDVDVSAAEDPTNKYYFAVQVDGVTTHTTIWAHGADARTYFPKRDVPTASGASCR